MAWPLDSTISQQFFQGSQGSLCGPQRADMFLQQDGSPRFHWAGQKTTAELIFPRARLGQAGEGGQRAGRVCQGASMLKARLLKELALGQGSF